MSAIRIRIAAREAAASLGVAACLCLTFLAAPEAQAAFPGAEGRIAFSIFHVRGGGYTINTMLPDGRGIEELAASDDRLAEPEWSPDGRTIVYAQGALGVSGPPSSIWTMNADGSAPERLAAGSSPSFSPDGRRIVYVAGESIRSMALNGRDDRRQFRLGCLGEPTPPCVNSPIYSPNGKRIVFERRRVLWSASPDGAERERLTPRGTRSVSPDFSPNGRLITFRREHETAIMRANGKRSRVLPNQPRFAISPAFSPTGRRIVGINWVPHFSTSACFDLFTIETTGEDYRPLTNVCPGLEAGSDPLEDPSWQPLPDPGA